MEDDVRLFKVVKYFFEFVFDFVELVNLLLSWINVIIDQCDDGESVFEEEDFDVRKLFGEVKVCFFNGIVLFSSELVFSIFFLGFWICMCSWFDNDVLDRRDLVECVLFSYGNSIIGGLLLLFVEDIDQLIFYRYCCY